MSEIKEETKEEIKKNTSPENEKKTSSLRENVGEVVSAKSKKTIVVNVTRRVQHPLYKKYLNVHKKFHVHDEKGEAKEGDFVRIRESKPLSKLKHWVFVKIEQR